MPTNDTDPRELQAALINEANRAIASGETPFPTALNLAARARSAIATMGSRGVSYVETIERWISDEVARRAAFGIRSELAARDSAIAAGIMPITTAADVDAEAERAAARWASHPEWRDGPKKREHRWTVRARDELGRERPDVAAFEGPGTATVLASWTAEPDDAFDAEGHARTVLARALAPAMSRAFPGEAEHTLFRRAMQAAGEALKKHPRTLAKRAEAEPDPAAPADKPKVDLSAVAKLLGLAPDATKADIIAALDSMKEVERQARAWLGPQPHDVLTDHTAWTRVELARYGTNPTADQLARIVRGLTNEGANRTSLRRALATTMFAADAVVGPTFTRIVARETTAEIGGLTQAQRAETEDALRKFYRRER